MVKFKIKLTDKDCAPTKAYPSDTGWDLYSAENVPLPPNSVCAVDCGFELQLPEGYGAQIRSRSGLALSPQICVANSPGTVDGTYRGSIKAILTNRGSLHYTIYKGDKIAQMTIERVEQSEYEIVDELDETDRGSKGFGSSGR